MNTSTPTPELLTTEEAASRLGMGVRSFTVARSSGALTLAPATRHGTRWLYLADEVEAVREERAAGRESGPCRVTDCPLRGARSRAYLCREHAAMVTQLGARVAELRGRPSAVRRHDLSPEDRFDSRVRLAATGDELWMGSRTSSGYGNVYDPDHGRMRKAHVVKFERAMGRPIGAGLELDHECEQRLCVRIGPGHVVEVSHGENMTRMAERVRARRTAQQAADLLSFPTPLPIESAPVKVTMLPCAA